MAKAKAKTKAKKLKLDWERLDWRVSNLLGGLSKLRAGEADKTDIKQIGRDGFEIYAYIESYLDDLDED